MSKERPVYNPITPKEEATNMRLYFEGREQRRQEQLRSTEAKMPPSK